MAKQGPREQGCSSGSAETSCTRKSSDHVSILVSQASGDAHMEGVREEQIMQQTQQMSRPADASSFEDGPLQQLKSAATRSARRHVLGAQPDKLREPRALPLLYCAWYTFYWDNKSTSKLKRSSAQNCCMRLSLLPAARRQLGFHLPQPLETGSRGVGREPRLLPEQAAEGMRDASTAAPSLPAWPHVPGIPAPALPGWQGTSCASAEQLQHLNSRHPRRPWTSCCAHVPLLQDSNSHWTGEETMQHPTVALVNHLFGLQLNFCSPLVTLPALDGLQDGHNTTLIRPSDRMRPWEDKQQTHRYLPLRFPGSRCQAGL